MTLFTRLAWRRMSYEDRVDLVEALLRNRAMMLDPKGRPMPGISLLGIAPTDEEFRARAREIVDATGKDQPAAMRHIDVFEGELVRRVEELGEKADRRVAELEKSLGVADDGTAETQPPPPA